MNTTPVAAGEADRADEDDDFDMPTYGQAVMEAISNAARLGAVCVVAALAYLGFRAESGVGLPPVDLTTIAWAAVTVAGVVGVVGLVLRVTEVRVWRRGVARAASGGDDR